MKKRIFITMLAMVMILFVFTASNADEEAMVTITNPDGTVVQMSLEDFMNMMGYSTSTSPTQAPTAQPDEPDAVPWPTYNLTKYPLAFEVKGRAQAYCGPSRNYAEAGAYMTNQASRLDGLFMEITYIFVEMNYPSVGLRRLYFNRGQILSTSGVPEITLIGYPAVTTESASAWYGPGRQYDPFDEASVGADTELTVFFEENGYVFAEYEANFQFVRAWIDANSVRPE